MSWEYVYSSSPPHVRCLSLAKIFRRQIRMNGTRRTLEICRMFSVDWSVVGEFFRWGFAIEKKPIGLFWKRQFDLTNASCWRHSNAHRNLTGRHGWFGPQCETLPGASTHPTLKGLSNAASVVDTLRRPLPHNLDRDWPRCSFDAKWQIKMSISLADNRLFYVHLWMASKFWSTWRHLAADPTHMTEIIAHKYFTTCLRRVHLSLVDIKWA